MYNSPTDEEVEDILRMVEILKGSDLLVGVDEVGRARSGRIQASPLA